MNIKIMKINKDNISVIILIVVTISLAIFFGRCNYVINNYVHDGFDQSGYELFEMTVRDKVHEYIRNIKSGSFVHYEECKYCEYYKIDPNLDVVSDQRRDSLDGYIK